MRTDSKLIGQGTYGCAFSPPVPCVKGKRGPGKLVGKVIDKFHADIELSLTTIIKGIEGWKRFYIVQEEDNCDKRNFLKSRETYASDCEVWKKARNENLTQLISTFGGMPMSRMSIKPTFDFIGSFRHMLEGVAKLAVQGICHYDIKENNVLVDSRGTMRLIDFGSAFLGDQVTEDTIWTHQYSFIPDYPPQAPEMAVQNALHDGLGTEYAIQEVSRGKNVFKLVENILGVRMDANAAAMRKFWTEQEEYRGDGKGWSPFFRAYWRNWDTWAVGVMYIRLLQMCFLQPIFVNGTWATHGPMIRQVLKGLLHADPRERLSASEALGLLQDWS